MQDARPDPALDPFLRGLATFRSLPAPRPGLALQQMFASTANLDARQIDPSTARRTPVYKRLLSTLPSKIAAGALGALLAGSAGTGAVTATMSLVSSEGDTATEVSVPAESDDVSGDDATQEGGDEAVDPAVEVEDDADEATSETEGEDVDGDGYSANPVSVAAHNHEFDEACGNHGHYVSHVARFGEEPECATDAAGDETTPETGATGDVSGDSTVAPVDSAEDGHSKAAKDGRQADKVVKTKSRHGHAKRQ